MSADLGREGLTYSHPELVKMADAAPAFACFIDPDDHVFLPAGDMPKRVVEYAAHKPERSAGCSALVRCIMESLAMQYRYVLELTEELSGQKFQGLHMVGGGIHNEILCQWTADAIGKPVWAGPAEAVPSGIWPCSGSRKASCPIYGKHAESLESPSRSRPTSRRKLPYGRRLTGCSVSGPGRDRIYEQ